MELKITPVGSPPRVWGKRPGPVSELPSQLVHPHACGENACLTIFFSPDFGSPPRVWGKPKAVLAPERGLRFTPTRVGKTSAHSQKSTLPSVHPHACGENFLCLNRGQHVDGSPPRVWGKLERSVGKIRPALVHPHACGENRSAGRNKARAAGSPPRVWGKRCGARKG